ncbi:8302_t:CDS:2 [Cetraspora pellucida]|uniref:8302_t:CDS:1 n=1 Tax=Cetraspora pellucida TaxID=1433469 RepID=A0A9N9ITH8_9GLOM|nr:8302_t:CDS:2 [Cetraspora pellucida]
MIEESTTYFLDLSYPTNIVSVISNTEKGNFIVLAEVRLGQRLYQIKKYYPTANKYVKILEISILKQEDIDEDDKGGYNEKENN